MLGLKHVVQAVGLEIEKGCGGGSSGGGGGSVFEEGRPTLREGEVRAEVGGSEVGGDGHG